MLANCRNAGSKCTLVEADAVPPSSVEVDNGDQVVLVECGTPGEEGYYSEPLLSEAFGPLLAIVELEEEDTKKEDYLSSVAVPFLNNKDNIYGSLSCMIFTPTKTNNTNNSGCGRRNIEPALASLQYGSIAVNQFNAFGYNASVQGGVWGGHPHETLGQSGNGQIGNQYGIGGVAKTVVYGPASLETKPLVDLANPPPPIVMDAVRELTCSASMFVGVVRVFKLILVRSVVGLVSLLPWLRNHKL